MATPIGHLGDLTRRAEEVLKSVEIVAAEDTRRTRVLLDHISHRAPSLVSLHEHNEDKLSADLISKLKAGADVALVSDAGTPLINDPGFTLVKLAHANRIRTIPLPGACSIIAALSVCPLPCHPFRFIGFMPTKAAARDEVVAQVYASGDATVFLEAPHRIVATLSALQTRDPEATRQVMIARELTKKFESVIVGSAAQVSTELLANLPEPKGEFVGIIQSSNELLVSYTERRVLSALLKDLPPTQAAKLAANICGAKKADMYKMAVRLTNPDD